MKISFFKNDKKTFWDEVVLGFIVAVCLIVGILLIVYKPSYGFINSNTSTIAGLIIAFIGIMYTPCLIYRLFTNEH